jgi:hypothetical protein
MVPAGEIPIRRLGVPTSGGLYQPRPVLTRSTRNWGSIPPGSFPGISHHWKWLIESSFRLFVPIAKSELIKKLIERML